MNGFELILPFLRPIQGLILDPEISEIMVNGTERIFIEKHGQIEAVELLLLRSPFRRYVASGGGGYHSRYSLSGDQLHDAASLLASFPAQSRTLERLARYRSQSNRVL